MAQLSPRIDTARLAVSSRSTQWSDGKPLLVDVNAGLREGVATTR
jgi:hypothetical protein